MIRVASFLKEFRAKAAMVQRQSPVDPYAYPIYASIILALIAEILVILATDFTFSANTLLSIFYAAFFLLFTGLLSRTYGLAKVALALEAIALPTIIGGLTAVATIELSAVASPFADAKLAAADRFFGFSWLGFFDYNLKYTWILNATYLAYRSIFYQTALTPVLVALIFGRSRLWKFIIAWLLASFLTAIIFPFFPAEGPYIFYRIPQGALPFVGFSAPWKFGPVIDGLRSGELREISWAMIGLVSFPSFHAASGIIFTWAFWPIIWLRLPMFVINSVMIMGTLVIGGHYLIDIFGGVSVMWFSIAMACWLSGAMGRLTGDTCVSKK